MDLTGCIFFLQKLVFKVHRRPDRNETLLSLGGTLLLIGYSDRPDPKKVRYSLYEKENNTYNGNALRFDSDLTVEFLHVFMVCKAHGRGCR